MRRLLGVIWPVVAIFMCAHPVAAQSPTVHVGVKGGLNLADIPQFRADIEQEGAVDLRYRYGVLAGGFVTVGLGDRVAFQPEALYTQKGFHGRDPSGPDETFDVQVDYLDVPLLLRFHSSAKSGIYGVAGPSINFNTSAKFVEQGDEEDVKDDVKDVEVGLVLGVGVQLSRFLIEGRYAQGLTNIAEDLPADVDSYRNRSFAVMVGVRFP